MTRAGTVAAVTVLWLALWGDLTVANVLGGLAVGVVLVVLFPVASLGAPMRVRPVATARFALLFLRRLVTSGSQVMWQVVHPRRTLATGIVAVRLRTDDPRVITLVGNATSLTPGTLSIETRDEPPTLYVHVLRLEDPDAVRRQVASFERLAIEAIGSPEARAALAEERRR